VSPSKYTRGFVQARQHKGHSRAAGRGRARCVMAAGAMGSREGAACEQPGLKCGSLFDPPNPNPNLGALLRLFRMWATCGPLPLPRWPTSLPPQHRSGAGRTPARHQNDQHTRCDMVIARRPRPASLRSDPAVLSSLEQLKGRHVGSP
jgi:hypothetical protein